MGNETSTEPSPLKYMGTQSRETVNMAAAMAHAVDAAGERTDRALGRVGDEVDTASSKLGDAAQWALGKAREALRSAARDVVARHETLRTSFDFTRFSVPVQLVHREVDVPVAVYAGADRQREFVAAERSVPFDLAP